MCEVLPFIDPLPFGLRADLYSLQFFRVGKIHIQTSQRGKPFLQNLAYNIADVGSGRFKVGIRFVTAKGESDGRHSFQATFNHDSHRTGVVDVYSRIISMIDATDYQVRFAVEHGMKGKFNAIHRSAGTFVSRHSYILTHQLVVNRLSHSHCSRTA